VKPKNLQLVFDLDALVKINYVRPPVHAGDDFWHLPPPGTVRHDRGGVKTSTTANGVV
jgi:hypothetical protein